MYDLVEIAAELAWQKGLDPEGAREHMRAWLLASREDFLKTEEIRLRRWSKMT